MAEKECRFTIYVARPKSMMPRGRRRRLRRRLEGRRDPLRSYGHVFIGLTNRWGVERRYGFYALCFAIGREKADSEDRIDGVQDLFKPVTGLLKDDITCHFHDAIQYAITGEQYKKALKVIRKWDRDKPAYILASNNCVTFAEHVARQIGLIPPAQVLFGVGSPAGTSWAIQAMERFETMAGRFFPRGGEVRESFAHAGRTIYVDRPGASDRRPEPDRLVRWRPNPTEKTRVPGGNFFTDVLLPFFRGHGGCRIRRFFRRLRGAKEGI